MTTLFPLFMAWAKTMGSSLRSELQTIGLALHEGRMDEVSRGIQSHLENAIVSFMLFKVVSKSMEAAADRVAGVMGDLLVEEEERAKVMIVLIASPLLHAVMPHPLPVPAPLFSRVNPVCVVPVACVPCRLPKQTKRPRKARRGRTRAKIKRRS